MDDHEIDLVRKAQLGSVSAFEDLVRRTSRLVYARLYLDLGDSHRAEDLLQETLILAYRSLRSLHDPQRLRPWLLTIAQNVMRDAIKSEHRLKRASPPRVSLDAVGECACPGLQPEEEVSRAEERQRVLESLRALPEEYQLPLALRYLAGADYAMIENQLGLTNGALRGLLHRGLKMLRAKLEPVLVG